MAPGRPRTLDQELANAKPETRGAARDILSQRQRDADLASVLDETALAKLAEGEQKAF
jgi:hypothetical protein